MAEVIYLGRRKTSVARVVLRSGKGEFKVNGRALDVFFPLKTSQDEALAPFKVTGTEGTFDVSANVNGGGFTGQAQAVRLAISRALSLMSGEYHTNLKKEGFLTRDPRMVERKKYGRPKARKRFQFSKR